MKERIPLLGIAAGAIMWIALMGCLFVEALQAWHINGEMAAIDRLQCMVVMGIPVTTLSAIAGFIVWAMLNDIIKKEGR